MTVYCYYCATVKGEDQFTTSRVELRAGALKGQCKQCTSEKNRAYREKNPEKLKEYGQRRQQNPERKEYDRQRSYQRRYGLSREEYNGMREAQQYRCYLCGLHEEEHKVSRWGNLCLDHDHRTGQVRRLLCATCNKGLGCFLDDPVLMERAAAYVRTFEKVKGVAS